MKKILISVPDRLMIRMKATIPDRQRSKTIAYLIEEEVKKREQLLYECAAEVERDYLLNQEEMKEWDSTLKDGLEDESW